MLPVQAVAHYPAPLQTSAHPGVLSVLQQVCVRGAPLGAAVPPPDVAGRPLLGPQGPGNRGAGIVAFGSSVDGSTDGISGSQGTPVSEACRWIPELSWADVTGTSGDRVPTWMTRPQSRFVLHLMRLRPERRALDSRSAERTLRPSGKSDSLHSKLRRSPGLSGPKAGPFLAPGGEEHPRLEHASAPRAPLSRAHGHSCPVL